MWTERPLIQCNHKISLRYPHREGMLQLGPLIWEGLLVTSIKMKSNVRKQKRLFEINCCVGLEDEGEFFSHFRLNYGSDAAPPVQPSLQSDALSEVDTNSPTFHAAYILASVLYRT